MPRPVSVAPMLKRTDRHFRFMLRQITRKALLYTEMITTGAIIHGDKEYLLGFSPEERPLALQLGGDDPSALAECAGIGEEWGYDEINLNVGCPSDRVQRGCFGAQLMARPNKVAACVAAMRNAVTLPVTVKHRIGIDQLDRYEDMLHFVRTVAEAGCDRFIVHARKAWLDGLSPKQNRTVPPLRHSEVHRLKRELSDLQVEINGGITTIDQIGNHLQHVDGVMLGRAALDDPFLFATVDQEFYGADGPSVTRRAVVEAMVPYANQWTSRGFKLAVVARHLLQLFVGQPGTRCWKRLLTENGSDPHQNGTALLEALEQVESIQMRRMG